MTDEELGRALLDRYRASGHQFCSVGKAARELVEEERPKMMIEGMSQNDIQDAMTAAIVKNSHSRPDSFECARIAHRLATTPRPVPDPDAEAKRWLKIAFPGHSGWEFAEVCVQEAMRRIAAAKGKNDDAG
jgi:hypothetical protein